VPSSRSQGAERAEASGFEATLMMGDDTPESRRTVKGLLLVPSGTQSTV